MEFGSHAVWRQAHGEQPNWNAIRDETQKTDYTDIGWIASMYPSQNDPHPTKTVVEPNELNQYFPIMVRTCFSNMCEINFE